MPQVPVRPGTTLRLGDGVEYHVDGELGQGAQAVVFQVARGGTGYALKVLRSSAAADEEQARAFRREAALLASVTAPGVARVHEVGLVEGHPYLLMDLVEGTALTRLLHAGPLAEERAAALACDVAAALSAAHRAGLVHRDVKPDNIIVKPEGLAWLVDFGLAARVEQRRADQVAGTLSYSAPEQSGMLNRPVDGRADLYALGAVLFECVTGMPPFRAPDVAELLRLHAVAPVPDPRSLAPGVSPALAGIIGKLLAKDPDDRYQSAGGLLADLRRVLNAPGSAPFVLGTADGAELAGGDRGVDLVGRDAELAALIARWERARRGHGGVVLVDGPAGSGKSRLATEIRAVAAAGGFPVLHGKSAGDDRQPLAPLRAAVDAYVRGELRQFPAQAAASVRRLRTAAGPGAALVKNLSPALADALEAPDLVGEVAPDRYAAAVASFLAGLARAARGAILHLDDAQWFDEGTTQVLQHLAHEVADVPLLIVVTARDDGASRPAVTAVTDRLGQAVDLSVTVRSLDAEAVGRLIAEASGGLKIPAEAAQSLAARSDGNPFTLLQYVKAIIDAGLAQPAWGTWRVDVDALGSLRLPRDAAQLVLQRIDTLDGESRRLLGVAAVIGARFAPDLVAAVGDVDDRRVLDLVTEAAQHRLVERRDAGGYAFLHDRIREALLAEFDEPARRELHDRIAAVLADRSDDSPEHVYALASHCAAGRPEQAAERMYRAGYAAARLALAEHAPQSALYFLEHAATAARRAGLAPDVGFGQTLGSAYHAVARFDDALSVLRETLAAATDRDERVRTLQLLARVYDSTWRAGDQLTTVERGLAELGRPMPRNRVWLLLTTGWLFALGCLVGITRIGFGTARGRRRELFRLQSTMYHYGAAASVRALRPLRSLVFALRLVYSINRLGPSPERARDLAALTLSMRMLGLHRFADRLTGTAARTAADLGDPVLGAYIQWMAAIATHGSGRDTGGALRRVAEEQRRWLDSGLVYDCYAVLALDSLLLGDTARAATVIGDFTRLAEAGGQRYRGITVGTVAALLALQGRAGEAAAELSRAGRPTGAHEQVDLVTGRLRAALERDDVGEAFEEAVAAFDAVGVQAYQLLPSQHCYHVFLAYGRLEQARRASGPQRAGRLAAARAAVRAVRPLGRRPLVAAHHRLLEADLVLLSGGGRGGGPAAALAALNKAEPVLRAVDAPLVAFGAALLRARALTALGVAGEAERQAEYALALAQRHGWSHRARRVAAEFSLGTSTAGASGRTTSGAGRDVRRWAALEQVSLAASRVLDPNRLTRIALDETLRILPAERAFLLLVEPDGGALVPHVGRDAAGHELTELSGYSRTLVERVRQTREALVVTGTEEGEALGSRSAVMHGLRSIMVAPLQVDGRLLGVVYLDSRVAKGVFTHEDADLLTAVTHHVAVALETARAARLEVAVQSANRQRALAETLRDAMAELASTLDPDEVLRRLLATVRLTPGARRAWLVRRGSGTSAAVLSDRRTGAVPAEGLTELFTLTGPCAVAAGAGWAAALTDHPGRYPSWLVVPLAVREEPVGALVLADVRGQAYGQREVEVAAAVAGQAMVAYDNARLFTQVHELAVTDSLTGAGTRRSFMDVARREVALARRGNRSLAAVMVDIDHFKRINDAYGHQVGDDVIQEVAARLRADHRGTDLLARYGGEEFVLLLPDVNAGAAKIAEALRAAVAAAPVQTRSGPVPVTVSVGVAHLRESDADLDALLGRADACLYRAKQGGRDSVVVDTDPT